MAKTCTTPARRFLCWYQPLLWELRSCPPRRATEPPGPQASPANHQCPAWDPPSCHHPESSSAAARSMPSTSRHWLAPHTWPGAWLNPGPLSSNARTPVPALLRHRLSCAGGRRQQGRGSVDEGAWAPAAPRDRFCAAHVGLGMCFTGRHWEDQGFLAELEKGWKFSYYVFKLVQLQTHKMYKGQLKGQTEALLFILKVCSGRGTLKLGKGSSNQGSTLWLSNIWHVLFYYFKE